jgi:hypothetical protein
MVSTGKLFRGIPVNFRETAAYLVCGVLTVIVNTACYLSLALVLPDLAANTAAFLSRLLLPIGQTPSLYFIKKYLPVRFFIFWG